MSVAGFHHRHISIAGQFASITEVGAGPPLVLLPSMVALTRTYRRTMHCLAPHFHIIAIELPGCGFASRLRKKVAGPGRAAGGERGGGPRCGPDAATAWNFRQYADCLADCLDLLDLRDLTLVGHSNSGAVALIAGALYPQRLARIILADTVGALPPRYLVPVLVRRGFDALLEPWLSLTAWHHLAFNILRHGRNFARQIHLAAHCDLADHAARISLPTLIAWGRRDHTMPLAGALRLHRIIPHSTLHISRTGSHDWIVDHPIEFADMARRFADFPACAATGTSSPPASTSGQSAPPPRR